MSFTLDNKSSSTLTQDNRTSVATITQDSKTTAGGLWTAGVSPWLLNFIWQWQGNGSDLTLDTRH